MRNWHKSPGWVLDLPLYNKRVWLSGIPLLIDLTNRPGFDRGRLVMSSVTLMLLGHNRSHRGNGWWRGCIFLHFFCCALCQLMSSFVPMHETGLRSKWPPSLFHLRLPHLIFYLALLCIFLSWQHVMPPSALATFPSHSSAGYLSWLAFFLILPSSFHVRQDVNYTGIESMKWARSSFRLQKPNCHSVVHYTSCKVFCHYHCRLSVYLMPWLVLLS